MNTASAKNDTRIAWHESGDPTTWATQAAQSIASPLAAALANGALHVRLLVSGGTTPKPVFDQLAQTDLDWSRIVIGLVDDRDVSADEDGSNQRMVRERLLRGRAAAARFQFLRGTSLALQDAVDRANARWSEQADLPVVVAVLGMGDDGHTASLFPDAANLDDVFADPRAYSFVDATGCPAAGDFSYRISLTPAGLAVATRRVLLIRGTEKLAVLNRALADGSIAEMPIRLVLPPGMPPLHVHWCFDV
ncbi:MAG: 6-phosphogluconolactonase [Dokdonella sp.]